jgi:hypothetical protein
VARDDLPYPPTALLARRVDRGNFTVEFSDIPPDGTIDLTRPYRALLGWLPEAQGEMILTGNTMGKEVTAEQRELAQRAREVVANRPAGVSQADVTADLPTELDDHVAQLRQSPAGAAMFQGGWEVALVDLTRVCAFQPHIVADAAVERVENVRVDDLEAIASIALPTSPPDPPRIQFDPSKQTYMVISPNSNLRIAGTAGGPVPDGAGAVMLGFAVLVMRSFVQVVRFRDRFLLHDGYHRAYGFLSRGITHVPAFTREMQTIEEVLPPGMCLPQHSYLGDRPPFLPDYLDDQVACTVRLPASQKMVLIQGIELNPGA